MPGRSDPAKSSSVSDPTRAVTSANECYRDFSPTILDAPRCILNHFHPLELFLTHRHHPSRVTKSRCSYGLTLSWSICTKGEILLTDVPFRRNITLLLSSFLFEALSLHF